MIGEENIFPNKIIETPLGQMSQGEFLEKIGWPLADKIFFREIWKALPHLSLDEVQKIKTEAMKNKETARTDAREYLKSVNAQPIAPTPGNTQWMPLNKTGAFPRMKRSTPSTDQDIPKTQKKPVAPSETVSSSGVPWGSLDKTGAFSSMKRTKPKTDQYPAVSRRTFHLSARCKACGHPHKFSQEKAGQTEPCQRCQQRVEIPNPNFYCRKDAQSDIQGPFLLSQRQEMIAHDKIVPDMLLSSDQKDWYKVDEDKDLVLHIAKEASSQDVRKAAIARITDQSVLATFILKETDRQIQQAALQKISDQEWLTAIMKDIEDSELLRQILDKVTSQSALAEFVKTTPHTALIAHAVPKLNDQKLLAELAGDMDENVRYAAVQKITEQGVLRERVRKDSSAKVRLAAIRNLVDQQVLFDLLPQIQDAETQALVVEKIVEESLCYAILGKVTDAKLRIMAVKKITNRDLLADIVQKEPDKDVRKTAATNLEDAQLLYSVVINDMEREVQATALQKINDVAILDNIAVTAQDSVIRNLALDRLDQSRLVKLALHADKAEARQGAAYRLSNYRLLPKVFQESQDMNVRWVVLKKLYDPSLLLQIACEDKDSLLCRLAESRIFDPALSTQIAQKAWDKAVRQAAAQKLSLLGLPIPTPDAKAIATAAKNATPAPTAVPQPVTFVPQPVTFVAGEAATTPYDAELVWRCLCKIAQQDRRLLLHYLAPVALQKLVEEHASQVPHQ
jgi:hypothetical protein